MFGLAAAPEMATAVPSDDAARSAVLVRLRPVAEV